MSSTSVTPNDANKKDSGLCILYQCGEVILVSSSQCDHQRCSLFSGVLVCVTTVPSTSLTLIKLFMYQCVEGKLLMVGSSHCDNPPCLIRLIKK